MTMSQALNVKPLTGRQTAVLNGLMAGESNQQIADRLNLTEYTIKYHCRGLYHRFGVSNRHELMSVLLQHGHKPAAKKRAGNRAKRPDSALAALSAERIAQMLATAQV